MKTLDIIFEMAGFPKKGSPEELVELLKFLPVDETAKYISEEIYQDLLKYNETGEQPKFGKIYEYHPQDKCLQPYTLEIGFKVTRNMAGIGYADSTYIEVKYLDREAHEFPQTKGNIGGLRKDLYHIIKHECSHFYLSQKDVEKCLYLTHPDGMKKYYHDRQELVLHSREIFERFEERSANWRTYPLETIIKRLKFQIDNLQNHTRIDYPFPASLRTKYLNFIVNNYIKPQLVNPS
jgi:hypothetical protein